MKNSLQKDAGTDLEKTARRFTLEADLAAWTDEQAELLKMSPSKFVGALLEWARAENVAYDEMLFRWPAIAPLSNIFEINVVACQFLPEGGLHLKDIDDRSPGEPHQEGPL